MRTMLISLAVLCLFNSEAQEFKTVYKVVPILSEQKFYLNGGARADFGGRSREILQVNLPLNTVEWYYAYTSTSAQKPTQLIGLASQLFRLFAPDESALINVLSKLVSPTGAGVCDVYLFRDQLSVNDFVTKKGLANFDLNGTRQNFKEGVVRISDAVKGPYILGIRNPSALEGVNVSIEVVAIVSERILVAKSPLQDEALLYAELGQKAYNDGEYEKCIDYDKKAIALDSTLCSSASNLALAYLVSGNPNAIDAYVKAIELMKQSPSSKKMLGNSIRELDDARQKFDNIKDLNLIKDLLTSEYAKR